MSFEKPFVVTEKHVKAWERSRKPLRCCLCGHVFQSGDTARWIFTNSDPDYRIAGNPHICQKCDGPKEDLLARLHALAEEFSGVQERFWWFIDKTSRQEAARASQEEANQAAREARYLTEDPSPLWGS